MAAMLAAIVVVQLAGAAARAIAQAAAPFPEIPLESRAHGSHLWAYTSLVGGVGMIGLSFAFSRQADRTYDDYLAATDPDQISELYDRTVRYDRLSSATLIGGEILVATGLYLRFLRRPTPSHVGLSVAPERCAVTWRF